MAESGPGFSMPLGPLTVDIEGIHLSEQDRKLLLQPAVGAVILFSRNYESCEQVSALVAEIKALRRPSLLVAVDQEGGRVQRFRNGFTELPPARAFGHIYDENPEQGERIAEAAGTLMAVEILGTGIDFSFAPVLDCANPASEVIGDRGFHSSPEIISILAGAFIRGMKTAGMAATGKHFPGHGGVGGDSHNLLPVDNRSLGEITSCDLVPYFRLVGELQGVMTAHVDFPEIDGAVPTFSRYWIGDVLRKQVGFGGMVFSDDLSMQGAHVAGTPLRRTRQALEAGCDMALICNDPDSAMEVAVKLGSEISLDTKRADAMRMHVTGTKIDCAKLKQTLSACT